MFGINGNKSQKLSTESYKGVRDFYPEDQAIQNYIFKIMRDSVESWGYIEYGASILEPAELYKSKTSEEITNEQTYTFKDRGDREVTLRPEMTPTVARMIAGRINEIPMPARWYSIPNLFRYEKPQRGRLREHWQLNVDIFGVEQSLADVEIILVANHIMKKFGAKDDDFEIRINSRELLNTLFEKLSVPKDKSQIITRIIDKKDKISPEAFREALEKEVPESFEKMINILNSNDGFFEFVSDSNEAKRMSEVISMLEKAGVNNLKFTPTLARGFDYYTGLVFEVFDTNKDNPRSLFGGGRYDNLTSMFGGKSVPAFGFGMGDITIRDFLEVHNLLPKISSSTQVWIAVAGETNMDEVYKLAGELRGKDLRVAVDISGRKLGDQIASAEKRMIPIILAVGQKEFESNQFTARRMIDRVEKVSNRENLPNELRSLL